MILYACQDSMFKYSQAIPLGTCKKLRLLLRIVFQPKINMKNCGQEHGLGKK